MESEGITSENRPESITENLVLPESEEIDFGEDTPLPAQVETEPEKEEDEEVQQDDPETEAFGDDNVEAMVETEEGPEEELTEDPEHGTDTVEEADGDKQSKPAARKEPSEPRLVQLPLSKIKQIMKLDPDVHIVSGEAIFLVTRAAELFVQNLAKEAYTHTAAGKKKTISKRDVEMTVESVDTLMFLEGMMNV